jgi:lipoyl(octanoyl) transferase
VRHLVTILERSVIELLAGYDIEANSRPDAPGVYVSGAKVASLGLRVRRGCSYHGLALNVDMDLEPFLRINPCGYAGLKMTQLRDLGVGLTFDKVAEDLLRRLVENLGYSRFERSDNENQLPVAPPMPDSKAHGEPDFDRKAH